MNLLGSLALKSSVFDFATSPELYNAFGVTTATINGTVYVYVSGFSDDGIQVLTLATDGTLTPHSAISGDSAILNGASELKTIEANGETYLAIVGAHADTVALYLIDNDGVGTDGELSFSHAITNSTTLDYSHYLEVIQASHGAYVVTTSYYSQALNVFKVNAAGELVLTDTVLDSQDAAYNLNGVYAVDHLTIGSRDFIFAGSDANDDGISVFELTSSGTLVSRAHVEPGGNRSLTQLVAMEFNGENVLVAFDSNYDDAFVYSVANNGSLTLLSTTNMGALGYYNLTDLTELVIDGVTFITAAADDNMLLVMSLDANDQLQVVQQIAGTPEFDNTNSVATVDINGRTFLLTTAYDSSRITAVEIGFGDEAVLGTEGADRIVGQRGDDDLIGLGGSDEIIGGDGDDLLSGRNGMDTLNGGRGEDVLLGGGQSDILEGGAAGDVLIGGGGRDTLAYTSSGAAVTIDLRDGIASGGHANGDLFRKVENVTGSVHNDKLFGDGYDNVLKGGDGRDKLSGRNGADTLRGGNGNDTLLGEGGADKLYGDNGADTLKGGGGNDVIFGGSGTDRIIGEAGNDTLTGDGGADVFVFADGFGDDEIADFTIGLDKMDFKGVSEINNLTDFYNSAFTISGNTIVSVGGGANSIVITGVTEGDLTADHFIF